MGDIPADATSELVRLRKNKAPGNEIGIIEPSLTSQVSVGELHRYDRCGAISLVGFQVVGQFKGFFEEDYQ